MVKFDFGLAVGRPGRRSKRASRQHTLGGSDAASQRNEYHGFSKPSLEEISSQAGVHLRAQGSGAGCTMSHVGAFAAAGGAGVCPDACGGDVGLRALWQFGASRAISEAACRRARGRQRTLAHPIAAWSWMRPWVEQGLSGACEVAAGRAAHDPSGAKRFAPQILCHRSTAESGCPKQATSLETRPESPSTESILRRESVIRASCSTIQAHMLGETREVPLGCCFRKKQEEIW